MEMIKGTEPAATLLGDFTVMSCWPFESSLQSELFPG